MKTPVTHLTRQAREDSRMLYGLQMIDMALFMCGRASGIDSAKKLNDGDKAVLKIVDVIRPPS